MPRVSAATLVKEGTPVPGGPDNEQYGNAVYAWKGNRFIVSPKGQVLGWYPDAPQTGGLLAEAKPAPRGLLEV
jgi:hypothetical protein